MWGIVEGKRARKKVNYDAAGYDEGDDSDVPNKIKKAKKKAIMSGGGATSSGAPPPSPSPLWRCTVPKGVNFAQGVIPKSAEVKLMTLSNAKVSGDKPIVGHAPEPYLWGGNPNFTKTETAAVNGTRDDNDNINTLLLCCLDSLGADIMIYEHECDPIRHGTYKFTNTTFKTPSPKERPTHGFGIPPRHRSNEALQAWYEHMETWCGAPPVAVVHLNRKGQQDEDLNFARPSMYPDTLHLYGLGAKDGDHRLSNSRKYLTTRAKIFNKPEIGDDFIKTLEGKNPMEKVKAFFNLFDGASNKAIGDLGEMIALDVLIARGATAYKHPSPNWHYDLLYAYPQAM